MKWITGLVCATLLLNASELSDTDLIDLKAAIEIVKAQNLEIKAAEYDIQSAAKDITIAKGYNYGKVDFTQDFARSNDAGNVFGFKLTAREASFNDFGFDQFLSAFGAAMTDPATGQPSFEAFAQNMGNEQMQQMLLQTQPENLNYPETRNFYQSKLSYMVPIYTGGQLSAYTKIAEAMQQMKSLEKEQLVNEKIYQTRKSFYDMALLESAICNLNTILDNIHTLEAMTRTMIDEGYAKNVDLLEVQAKRANVERMIAHMTSSKQLLYHFLSFLLDRTITAVKTPEAPVAMPELDNSRILEQNIDIQRAETGLKIRNTMVDLSYSPYLPSIGAFAEIATADNSFLGDAEDHKAYTLGARLSWNLFNGGADAAALEKAKIEQLKIKTQLQLAKKGIALQIDKIRTEIRSFDLEISSLEKELELANQIYANYAGRYREHLSSMSDVIIKQSEQIEKILHLQQVKNGRNERIFALEKLANGVQQ